MRQKCEDSASWEGQARDPQARCEVFGWRAAAHERVGWARMLAPFSAGPARPRGIAAPRQPAIKLTLCFAAITVAGTYQHIILREDEMRNLGIGLGGLALAALAVSSANAQGTVKIGVVLTLSGQFADAGVQL